MSFCNKGGNEQNESKVRNKTPAQLILRYVRHVSIWLISSYKVSPGWHLTAVKFHIKIIVLALIHTKWSNVTLLQEFKAAVLTDLNQRGLKNTLQQLLC